MGLNYQNLTQRIVSDIMTNDRNFQLLFTNQSHSANH